jgi:hypothetical protein
MRNKFVADYIFEKTQQRRTPKQVGSRIQQLRDTHSGKQSKSSSIFAGIADIADDSLVLKVISDRHYEMMHPKRASTSSGQSSACGMQSSLCPPCPSHMYIPTLPASAIWDLQTYGQPSSMLGDIYSQQPRPLRLVDPTVTFRSAGQTPCQSIFRVYRDHRLVHQEMTMVSIRAVHDSTSPSPTWLYSTTLAPNFWGHLCEVEGACHMDRASCSLTHVAHRAVRLYGAPRGCAHASFNAGAAGTADALRLLSLCQRLAGGTSAAVPALELWRLGDGRGIFAVTGVLCTSAPVEHAPHESLMLAALAADVRCKPGPSGGRREAVL